MEPERKERLGKKWTCYSCEIKFYDMNRPEPTCPKCQADQRESPVFEKKKPARARAKKKTARKKKVTAKKKATALAALDDDTQTTAPPDEDKARPIDEIDPNAMASNAAGDDA